MYLSRLFITIFLFFLTFMISVVGAELHRTSNNQVTLLLKDDEVAIFGYGSLMLREQLHTITDDNIYNGPFIKAKLCGFKRSWSARYFFDFVEGYDYNDSSIPQSITFLNIQPDSNSIVNGMIFVCNKSELTYYDQRESIYDRIKITDKLLDICIVGGDAFAYTAKSTYFFPTENANKNETIIGQYYLDIIKEALTQRGDQFRKDYDNSTQPLPTQLVSKI